MKRTRIHSLPNGTFTRSAARYSREWNRLARPVAKALGCEVLGVDPGILIRPIGGGWPVTLSVSMAQRIKTLL